MSAVPKGFVQLVPKSDSSAFQRARSICCSQLVCVTGFFEPCLTDIRLMKGKLLLKKRISIVRWISIVKIWARKSNNFLELKKRTNPNAHLVTIHQILVLSHNTYLRNSLAASNSTSNSLLQTSPFHLVLIERCFVKGISGEKKFKREMSWGLSSKNWFSLSADISILLNENREQEGDGLPRWS